jgi:hypothetical protein
MQSRPLLARSYLLDALGGVVVDKRYGRFALGWPDLLAAAMRVVTVGKERGRGQPEKIQMGNRVEACREREDGGG